MTFDSSSPLAKAISVAVVQILIVASLGAKLLYDRRTRPQAWFLTQRYDPNLPIRGRYLSLQLEVNDPRTPEEVQQKFSNELQQHNQYRLAYGYGRECGSVEVRDGKPVAIFDNTPAYNCENLSFERWPRANQTVLRIVEPVLFFIPDTANDPRIHRGGEELWVLATIPGKGRPRPIALGMKIAGETNIQPLPLN
jgi:hypothetical protein